MPSTETANLQTARLTLNSTETWAECWELRTGSSNGYFVTSNNEAVTFAGVTYSPFPMTRAAIEKTQAGDITEITVEIANVDRVMGGLTASMNGCVVILRIVNTANLATSTDCYTERFTVRTVDINEASCVLHLGAINPYSLDVPSNRFQRGRCRWLPRYGGAECGYDTTRSGALSTCDGTLNGANGCVAHGTDEVNAGKPRIHPLRFGAWPSILKGSFA